MPQQLVGLIETFYSIDPLSEFGVTPVAIILEVSVQKCDPVHYASGWSRRMTGRQQLKAMR